VSKIPDYEAGLAAFHQAHAGTLQRMVRELPLAAGDKVLDMACGDGRYTRWLAEGVAPGGEVIAVDLLPSYLKRARQTAGHVAQAKLRFERGDIRDLPFPGETFDLAWCAQSLFSFPDPPQALRELRRVVRSAGMVAVLENDTLHQFLLSWPADLEIALRDAEHLAFERSSGEAPKYYVGRRLRTLFVDAGLKPQRKRIYAAMWEPPFTPDQKRFLKLYLNDLKKRTWPFLASAFKKRAGLLLDPRSPTYLLDDPNLSVTCLDYVMIGKR
jgi:SAM-dependent methyltransferase